MCGISGYINYNNRPIKETSRIISMLKVQKHRGPDDSGIRAFNLDSGESIELATTEPQSIEGKFEGVLGFNRLSILDLSMNGHQPMVSPDGNVLLTLNGEIYNAFDEKKDLEAWGYRFKSTTDTEVVLALYLRYGFEGMLERLNGMFAIVIINLKDKQVLITRDRFGIKPMYYLVTNETFAFSSELKSFKYVDGFDFDLEESQLDEFLLFRNNIKGTLFKDIKSLDPGHYIVYKKNQQPVIRRYFDINTSVRSNESKGNLDYYGEQMESWLAKSVQSQLMSDVKLGCQLSGGIDSSLVTWLANRNSKKGNFEAVSIVFNNRSYNEEQYIDHVQKCLNIPSHKFLLDSDYYLDNFEKATWHLEVPINHPNTIGIFKLSQKAKEYVTVLLSGEGADEVFGGYSRFYNIRYPFRARLLLHEIRKNKAQPYRLINYFSQDYRAIMATAFMTPELAGKMRQGFNEKRAMEIRRSLYGKLNGSMFDRQVKYEMQSYLPDLLIRQDKMSMAHSIENRVPFLDNDIVDKSFSIPEKYLLLRRSPEGRNTEKYLLKKMTAEPFGKDFAFRNKMGFGIPLKDFFRNDAFSAYLHDKIYPGIVRRGLFNRKVFSSWLNNIDHLGFREVEALWIFISFEIWASIYLDNNYENWNSP